MAIAKRVVLMLLPADVFRLNWLAVRRKMSRESLVRALLIAEARATKARDQVRTCTHCANPTWGGRIRCERHVMEARAANKRWRERQKTLTRRS